MAIYPSPDRLDEKNKYELVILAAKRARQIKDGAKPQVETTSGNNITIALEELACGAIDKRIVDDPSLNAQKAALKPNEPTLEDIIGAGTLDFDLEAGMSLADIGLDDLVDPELFEVEDSVEDGNEDSLADDEEDNSDNEV